MGLSVAEVAGRAGVDADYLEQVEQGTVVASDAFTLRIAKLLGGWMAEANQ
jgi:transcriptional regulator with XRE-family HTH domain